MNSYANLFVHLAWATWNRETLIVPKIQHMLYATIADHRRRCGGLPLEIGGIADHVHILARYPATIAIAQFVHDIKGGSSHHIRQRLFPTTDFRWQGSYGATSVDPEGISAIRAYIQNQQQHHAQGTVIPNWERCYEEFHKEIVK